MYTVPLHRTRAQVHFLVLTPQRIIRTFPVWAHHVYFKVKESLRFQSVSHPSKSVMSLLNVTLRPFPRVLSSPSALPSRLSAPTTPIGRSRHNSPSARARWSESGQMADSAQNTGHDFNLANLFSYVDPEHTPMIFPNSHHDYQSRRQSDSHLS